MSAFLTLIATLLVGYHVPVACHAPPGGWGDTKSLRIVGETMYGPTRIFLRDCGVEVRRTAVDTFAHEIMHAEHPHWSERRVQSLEHWYGGVVLRVIHRED